MATLILGTIGRIVAGPIGAIVGSLVGGSIDRGVLGSGRSREQGRISNPAVQSATYGEPIPLVAGRMRVAGNLIWTSGIREAATISGGGKRSGPATTSYSYSASFAVGLSSRQIADIARIWADGSLIRDAAGSFVTPTVMRLHRGDADQPVDPLIAAAEGLDQTPAYRGLAYAVFEDLPLADYGNRIPNLTFEIIADEALASIGDVISAFVDRPGQPAVVVSGAFPALTGYIAAQSGSVADMLVPLLAAGDAVIVGGAPIVIQGRGGDPTVIDNGVVDAHHPADDRRTERRRRACSDAQPSCVELAFYDTSRDYQPGLQRARRSVETHVAHRSLAAAMTPADAKALATNQLNVIQAAQLRQSVRLSWRHVGLVPGMQLRFAGEADVWRIRESRFENFIVHLDLERTLPRREPTPAAPEREADGGRAAISEIATIGPTALQVLDLPPLDGELPSLPRLWVAGAGAGPGWRRAAVLHSADNGDTFTTLGNLEGGAILGTAETVLPNGPRDRWDRHSAVDIILLSERDWLESRSESSVLAGANLAVLGDELIQFADAEALGPQRFRLRGLLRGRRGTEASTSGHMAGDRFVLIDPSRMLSVMPSLETLGRTGVVRSAGAGDTPPVDVSFRVAGAALRPLSPAHLRARRDHGDLVVEWIRRSRAGFGWTDFVDAPLAEAVEAYRVEWIADGVPVQIDEVSTPTARLAGLDQLEATGVRSIDVRVAQQSAVVGPGAAAALHIVF